ncbi:MAG TPA: energy transducer TonB [Gemmatimonadaceae bacterium]|nr:energy transducer TonB [Gemmatimonadaceae bacterium]
MIARRLVAGFLVCCSVSSAALAQQRAAVVHGDSGSIAVWIDHDTAWTYVVGPRTTTAISGDTSLLMRWVDSAARVVGVSPDSARVLRVAAPLTYRPVGAWSNDQVERQADEDTGSANPRYPDQLRADKVRGWVTAQFVVDSVGRPIVGSFTVLQSSNQLFTLAVFSALPDLRFLPAEVGGQPVSELIQMPVEFGPRIEPVSVHGQGGKATVSFAHDTAWLVVETAKGTFAVHADSFTMAAWADRAADAHAPKPHGTKKSDYTQIVLSYPEASLHATVAMGFLRLKPDSAPPFQLSGSNGSWVGELVLPYDSAQRLFAAMHGSAATMGVWRAWQPADTLRRPPRRIRNVEQQARPKSGGAPQYPESLRQSRTQGSVLMEFVVDTTGVIDLSTVRMLKSDHPLLGLAVYRALPDMRYEPAHLGGRPVREVIVQPYAFNLRP